MVHTFCIAISYDTARQFHDSIGKDTTKALSCQGFCEIFFLAGSQSFTKMQLTIRFLIVNFKVVIWQEIGR